MLRNQPKKKKKKRIKRSRKFKILIIQEEKDLDWRVCIGERQGKHKKENVNPVLILSYYSKKSYLKFYTCVCIYIILLLYKKIITST